MIDDHSKGRARKSDDVGAPVLVDKHGEKGNDVLSLIVRNLSIDGCLFNKWTIALRMDNQMSSFSAKPSLGQKTNRTNGTAEDPKWLHTSRIPFICGTAYCPSPGFLFALQSENTFYRTTAD